MIVVSATAIAITTIAAALTRRTPNRSTIAAANGALRPPPPG
jgi:hypothetical protein